MNKKAQTPGDVILAVVFLLVLAIGGLFAFYIFDDVFDGFENSSMNSSVTYPVFEKGRAVNSMWDYITLAMLFGFAIAIIIAGYFIDVHSIFLPIYIIGLILGEALAWILAYVWEQLIASSPADLALVATNNFPITNAILSNLPVYFIIIGVLGMIATYAKVNA